MTERLLQRIVYRNHRDCEAAPRNPPSLTEQRRSEGSASPGAALVRLVRRPIREWRLWMIPADNREWFGWPAMTGYFVFVDFLDRKSTRLNSSHLVISYAV